MTKQNLKNEGAAENAKISSPEVVSSNKVV